MRTTLNVEDSLYRDLKVRAAQEGLTVTSVIEEALRAYLHGSTARATAELPVLAESGGTLPGVDLRDPQTVFDALYGEDAPE